MKFQDKLFLALFVTAAALLAAFSFLAHAQLRDQLEIQYLKQYQGLTAIIGDTLQQLEQEAEAISVNSVKYLAEYQNAHGVPSEEKLKDLKRELRSSQLCVTDEKGRLIRDTDTPVSERKFGLFDFCEGYRNLITGKSDIEITPILPSFPSYEAYKFTMIPDEKHAHILEAGVRLDFIGEVLRKALQSDKNIDSIGLFTPSGFRLGYISALESPGAAPENSSLQPNRLAPADARPGFRVDGNQTIFVRTVPATSKYCCECIKKKLTDENGHYFYVLRAEVSRAPLVEALRVLRKHLAVALLAGLFIAAIIARWLSAFLVQRLDSMSNTVRKIASSNNLALRVDIQGTDELASLGQSFNALLSHLQATQKQIVEAEQIKSVNKMARQVAHDIRSPLSALRIVLDDLSQFPEGYRVLIRTALTRINDIANNLLNHQREQKESGGSISPVLLSSLIEGLLSEKRTQFRSRMGIQIRSRIEGSSYGLFVRASSIELKRVLSNLINNSVEAIENSGSVTVSVRKDGDHAVIHVRDDGKGIPRKVLPELGQDGKTFGKTGGSGLGLYHARTSVESLGGNFALSSEEGAWTEAVIRLPAVRAPEWFLPELVLSPSMDIIVLDDDSSIHEIWNQRFAEMDLQRLGIEVLHYYKGSDAESHVRELAGRNRTAICLFDQELRGEPRTGIELAAGLVGETGGSFILVTSHDEESQLKERCVELGLKLLPKTLAGMVPIRLDSGQGGKG